MDNTQLTNTADYRQFKNCFDNEIRKVADGFVKIGYLLKVARDTDILYESGYKSITEFAQAEYNMTKDVVSRYIAINDKYSENGYSEYLQERYEGYGIAKLAEMLTLPDAVVEAMHPQLTRKEIQEIKAEVRAEEAVTEIEVMLEEKDKNTEEMSIMQKVLYQYFKENRLDFIGMAAVIKKESENSIEETLDIFAPSGIAVKTVRIAGEGKFMLSFKGKDNDIELVNVRGNSTTKHKWQEFFHELTGIFAEGTKEEWEQIYKEPFAKTDPAKEETEEKVAPVQPEVQVVVDGEVVTEQEDLIPHENLEYHEEPGQIPGQMIVDDYPEIQPDGEWNSMYRVGEIVDDLKNNRIGKLVRKTGKKGIWEIKEKTDAGYGIYEEHEGHFKRSHGKFVDNHVDNYVNNSTETPQNVENTKCDTDSGEKLENVDKIAEIVEEETPQSIENTKCERKWTKDRIMRLFTQFVSLRDNVDCTKEEYSQLVSTASILVAIAERQEK
ncbi:MAG: hypothetical protein K2N51_00250 [Lachnospiraceae bacterium]|nr:hypothetical protein [Lachnospiraceae bacterium]